MARPQITVRMYKGLLGDCFLLMLERDGKRENILIDCGILQNIAGDAALMRKVADNIVKDTGGEIHLLVVTHEHWDHISGFAHARDIFLEGDALKIHRLWLAWTERADDDQAEKLRARFDKVKRGVAAAVKHNERLRAAAGDGADKMPPSAVDGLEDFIGPMGKTLAARGRMSGAQIMAKLKERVGEENIDYLEPGDVTATPGPVRLNTYVLGPPRDETRLFNDLPRRGEDRETYVERRAASLRLMAAAEALAGDLRMPDGVERPEDGSPFSRRNRTVRDVTLFGEMEKPEADRDKLVHDLWDIRSRYLADSEVDRRIDNDWTGAGGMLAMKLDSDTNNTSLVLAFEVEEGGGVLLFAADAQVGNWLSWHDAFPKNGDGQPSAEDILNRTILYKVGHHCSHNATLRAQGLEMMTHPGLVAMIPVVQEIAATKKGWHMPFPPLLERLTSQTEGRVLRGDRPAGEGLAPGGEAPPKAFLARVDSKQLYVDYRIDGA